MSTHDKVPSRESLSVDQFSLAVNDFHWPVVPQRPPQPPPLFTLHVKAPGNRVCLMCWKFHGTLLSPLLSHSLHLSSLRLVIACSLPTFSSSYLPPPSSFTPSPRGLEADSLSLASEEDAERVNEQGSVKKERERVREIRK